MTAFSAVRPSAIKLKSAVRFPARVVGGTAISVDKEHGTYTIDLDYSELNEVATFDPAFVEVAIWNPHTDEWARVSLTGLISGSLTPAAFDAISPTTTRGDIIYRNATTNTRLGAGTAGYLLQTNGAGADPTWSGFLQSGTGAVTRTWQDKARDIVHAKDFNVKADGVTDDTTAAQAAINSLAKILVWPPGTILIGAAGLTGVSNQVWRGQGRDATIFKLNANPSSDFITFSGKTGFEISDLTIDYNNKTPAGNNGSLGIGSCSSFAVRRVKFLHINKFGLIGSNLSSDWVIEGNYFSKDTAATTNNNAILLSSAAGPNIGGRISYNILSSSGMGLSCKQTMVIFNNVSGWGYGAGLTFEQDTAACQQNIIFGNICRDSNAATDADGYNPGGIENWGSDTVISGNILYDNCGTGMDQGGKRCSVVGNIAIGNGTLAGANGISGRYFSSTYNQDHSAYVGNVSRDLGSSVQKYGYQGQANTTYQNLSGNSFQGATLPVDLGSGNYRSFSGPALEGSTGSGGQTLANGLGITIGGITIPGATFGDRVAVSIGVDAQGMVLYGYVSAANTVSVRYQNNTGGSVTFAAHTLRVTVWKGSDAATF